MEGKKGEGRYKGSLLLREGRGEKMEGRGRRKGKGWKGRGKDHLVLLTPPPDMKS